ncbi:MAG: hypothetical protein H0U76_01785 [Ktedonobacteraceae bacterium]|nr:hypothetical protein [Ktedonobacteraceae bacterium]MBA3824466.1 hypothetical protein [Ktedonobacterales bacterium]
MLALLALGELPTIPGIHPELDGMMQALRERAKHREAMQGERWLPEVL